LSRCVLMAISQKHTPCGDKWLHRLDSKLPASVMQINIALPC
jgi:hypothetical protein